jgi:hypothetical protein
MGLISVFDDAAETQSHDGVVLIGHVWIGAPDLKQKYLA